MWAEYAGSWRQKMTLDTPINKDITFSEFAYLAPYRRWLSEMVQERAVLNFQNLDELFANEKFT
jgi:hypothetical protein